jgi:SAM-dependent methyltransferase
MKTPPLPHRDTCPSCGSGNLLPFHRVEGAPVHSVLLMRTREAAVSYPRGTLDLAFCRDCGFIANLAFDPDLHEYSTECEETQGYSPTFGAFQRRLAEHLVARYDLHDKDIVEIGCGKGEFLTLLCELGVNRGVGFDPAYRPDRGREPGAGSVTFVQDFYGEKYGDHEADFVCCKMTLEHIHDTAAFAGTVRRSLGDRHETAVFFQVPDVVRILQDVAFWDIYYEHCSYFSLGSLARLFRRCGFDVLDLWRDYGDQYIMLEAHPGNDTPSDPLPQEHDLEELTRLVEAFPAAYETRLTAWRQFFGDACAEKRRAVLWGSGSKAVAFLTTLDCGDAIEYVVDINPYRQGTFVAGTGQEIVAPAFLEEYRPDTVVIMNPVYRDEIQNDLAARGIAPQVVCVS